MFQLVENALRAAVFPVLGIAENNRRGVITALIERAFKRIDGRLVQNVVLVERLGGPAAGLQLDLNLLAAFAAHAQALAPVHFEGGIILEKVIYNLFFHTALR